MNSYGKNNKKTSQKEQSFDTDLELKKGLYYHRTGKLTEAEEIYKKILDVDPSNSDALHLLGYIAYQRGQNNRSIQLISKAIQFAPNSPSYYNNLGLAYNAMGQSEKAISSYKKALQLKPELPEAFHNMGITFQDMKSHDEALFCYSKALEINPGLSESLNNMGNIFKYKGELDKALSYYKKAIDCRHDYAEAYNNMGTVYRELLNFGEAITCHKKALAVKPEFEEALFNLGIIFQEQGKFEKAVSYYEKALQIKPQMTGCYANIGIIYRNMRNFEKAISCYKKGIEAIPDCAEFLENIGIILHESGKYDVAISFYKKAVAIGIDNQDILRSMGIAYYDLGNLKKAEECYIKSIKIDPGNVESLAQLIHLLQQNCEWTRVEQYVHQLNARLKKDISCVRKSPALPFLSLSIHHNNPALNYEIAKKRSSCISDHTGKKKSSFSFDIYRKNDNKIKIGYLSNDFRNHPVAHLIMGLFALHNRTNFQIYCYSYGKDEGLFYRDRIKDGCDSFIDIRNLSNEDAALQIYNDKIDILVDLMGYTAGNRLEICALRPAPVQVSWLGFPGTTGADFFDYIIVDRIVVPENQKPFYSEKMVYMPHSYQINADNQIIADKKWTKRDVGLPENSFVFCSFNQEYKIEPVIFNAWMNILNQVGNSVLWLLSKNRLAQNNLIEYAIDKGIDPQRIIFATSLEKSEHLSRHQFADLALDTRIYNGHTTTSDALWAGTPVIALKGKHFASRVSSSILSSIGLSHLITETLGEYEKLAITLANNTRELNLIQKDLKEKRLSEPLFGTARYAENLEQAYIEMYNIFLQGGKPRCINVLEG